VVDCKSVLSWVKKYISTLAGLEPTRDKPNWFLVNRLNRSATVSVVQSAKYKQHSLVILLFYTSKSHHPAFLLLHLKIQSQTNYYNKLNTTHDFHQHSKIILIFNGNNLSLHLPITSIHIHIHTVFSLWIVRTFKTLKSIVSQTLQICFTCLINILRDTLGHKIFNIATFVLTTSWTFSWPKIFWFRVLNWLQLLRWTNKSLIECEVTLTIQPQRKFCMI
jgi:hypothetical protein